MVDEVISVQPAVSQISSTKWIYSDVGGFNSIAFGEGLRALEIQQYRKADKFYLVGLGFYAGKLKFTQEDSNNSCHLRYFYILK